MLVAIVMIVCAVLWLAIQKNLADQGIEPLSRGQLRYMRKKARKQGVDVSQIDYNPRRGTKPYQSPEMKRQAKILRDFQRDPFKPPRKR